MVRVRALASGYAPPIVFNILNIMRLAIKTCLVQACLADSARVRKTSAEPPGAHEVHALHLIFSLNRLCGGGTCG